MKRILAISDIHGKYDEFVELLEKVEYSYLDDQLILLGDYTDRGKKSREVVEAVMELVGNGAIALRGNHDQMLLDWLEKGEAERFLRNGGMTTIVSFFGQECEISELDTARTFILEHFLEHMEFIRNLPYYYENEDHIFIHAGINPEFKDWKQTPKHEMLWIRDLFYEHATQTSKTVVFGHTPTTKLHSSGDIWFNDDKIGIDGGCVYGLQLNCLEINTKGYKSYFVTSKEYSQIGK